MSNSLAIAAIVLFILTIIMVSALLIFFVIILRKSEDESDFTLPICLNWFSKKSNYKFLGVEKEIKNCKGGRILVEFEPKDVKEKSENELLILEKNKRITLPRGTPSKERNIVLYLPNNSDDFDEEFKKTDIGKAFMWLTELKNLEKTQVDMIKEGSIRKDELLLRIGDGEISKQFLSMTDEIVKDSLRRAVSKEDKKDTYIGGGMPQHG